MYQVLTPPLGSVLPRQYTFSLHIRLLWVKTNLGSPPSPALTSSPASHPSFWSLPLSSPISQTGNFGILSEFSLSTQEGKSLSYSKAFNGSLLPSEQQERRRKITTMAFSPHGWTKCWTSCHCPRFTDEENGLSGWRSCLKCPKWPRLSGGWGGHTQESSQSTCLWSKRPHSFHRPWMHISSAVLWGYDLLCLLLPMLSTYLSFNQFIFT